jgi:internalin A
LSALTALTNLRSLDLSDTGVNDVSALTALRNLRSLDLSGIDVSDVSVLAALTNLQSLDLRITALNDLSPLFRFACLRKLAVSPEYWSDEMAEQIKRNNPEVKIYVAFSEDYIEAFYE